MISPEDILDRTDTCLMLGISRQTLIAWIRKGKIKVWKRVGHGSNAALLFERAHIESFTQPSIKEEANDLAMEMTSQPA